MRPVGSWMISRPNFSLRRGISGQPKLCADGLGARPRWRPTSPARSLASRDKDGGQSRDTRSRGARPAVAFRPNPIVSCTTRAGLGKRGLNLPRPAPGGGDAPEQSIRAAGGSVAADAVREVRPQERRFTTVCKCQAGGGCRRHPRTWVRFPRVERRITPNAESGRDVAVPATDETTSPKA